MRWRQRVIEERSKGSSWQKNSSPQRYWKYGFSTQRAHSSSSERSKVCLRIARSRHQPGRQRRHAGAIAVDRAALLLDEAPRDRFRELHQLMLHVDDLVEPVRGTDPARPSPGAPVASCAISSVPLASRESRFAESRNPQSNLQGNAPYQSAFRQNQTLQTAQSLNGVSELRIVHGRRNCRW